MSMADIKTYLNVNDQNLIDYLVNLEKAGFANLYRDNRGKVQLARATYKGLEAANPIDYYKYILQYKAICFNCNEHGAYSFPKRGNVMAKYAMSKGRDIPKVVIPDNLLAERRLQVLHSYFQWWTEVIAKEFGIEKARKLAINWGGKKGIHTARLHKSYLVKKGVAPK